MKPLYRSDVTHMDTTCSLSTDGPISADEEFLLNLCTFLLTVVN